MCGHTEVPVKRPQHKKQEKCGERRTTCIEEKELSPDLGFQSMMHYREQNGRWHVNHVQRDIQIALTKKYMWKKNEHADFDIEQTYVVQQLKTSSVTPIEKSHRMNKNESMTKQARFKDDAFWASFATVRPQKLETYLDVNP